MSQPIVHSVTSPPLSPPSANLLRTSSNTAASEPSSRTPFIVTPKRRSSSISNTNSDRILKLSSAPKIVNAPSAHVPHRASSAHTPPHAPLDHLSVQTAAPQQRDPSLLRNSHPAQDPNSQQPNNIQYQLGPDGHFLLNQHNYQQRDRHMVQAFRAVMSSGNHDWIILTDLARMASQHQLSPYSVMKFGQLGSPLAYIPITLHQPTLVQQTMVRQRQSETSAVEWLLSKKRKVALIQETSAKPESCLGPLLPSEAATCSAGIKRPASISVPPEPPAKCLVRINQDHNPDIEAQIDQAISQQLVSSTTLPASQSLPESARSDPSTNPIDHTLFQRQASGGVATKQPNPTSQFDPVAQAKNPLLQTTTPPLQPDSMAQQLENPPPHHHHHQAQPAQQPCESQQQPPVVQSPSPRSPQKPIKKSDTHPIQISSIIPEHLLQQISVKVVETAPHQCRGLFETKPQVMKPVPSYIDPEAHSDQQIHSGRLIRLGNVVELVSISSMGAPGIQSQAQIADDASKETAAAAAAAAAVEATANALQGEPSTPMIGNLLLSSCPGKKVRLTGPVRGRGAICRDLSLDLKRIYNCGIRAIICCLDDEELSFLGAPWHEYEHEADQLGIDVIRLPMAEGFAPTCVREMDAAITAVVLDYTLKGISVLVHCRGGIGRAGLVACAWMLKMGLVGPAGVVNQSRVVSAGLPSSDNRNASQLSDSTCGLQPCNTGSIRLPQTAQHMAWQLAVDAEDSEKNIMDQSQLILDTVERLIDTIRRRRSPKAIETAEQVKFIVEYVTFIHRQERLAQFEERRRK